MTLIIGIQLENSTIIAADHRLTQDVGQASLKTVVNNYQKVTIWNNKVFTGSGDALVLNRVKNLIEQSENSDTLSKKFLYEVQRRKEEIGFNKHIDKTKILFSSLLDSRPQLEFFSLNTNGKLYSNLVEPMSIEMTLQPELIESLSENLVSLYGCLKNINEFNSDEEWLNFYIEKFKTIYFLASKNDSTVSSTFHICGHTHNRILIKNIN